MPDLTCAGPPPQQLRAAGINYLRTETGGWIYKHQICISNIVSMRVQFIDGEPDTYVKLCQMCREHSLDYNSR